MVIRECVWDVCVYISCTGDEGQLGSSFPWNGRGGMIMNISMRSSWEETFLACL